MRDPELKPMSYSDLTPEQLRTRRDALRMLSGDEQRPTETKIMNGNPDSIEMPRYLCRKIVHALQIASVELRDDGADVYPADEGYAPFEVSADWAARYKPVDGDEGYYVVYDGGYASWSPSKAFRDGYTMIDLHGYATDEAVSDLSQQIAALKEAAYFILAPAEDLKEGVLYRIRAAIAQAEGQS